MPRPLRLSNLLIATSLFFLTTHTQGQTTRPESSSLVPPEFMARASALEAAVMAGDPAALPKFMDIGAILERATSGVPASKSFHDGFIKGAGSGGGLTDMLAQIRKQGATYRVLHVQIRDGNVHGIFRVLMPDGRVNYHDWIFEKSADGEIRIVDGYMAASGEYISATLRRIYVAAAAQAEPSLTDRILGADHSFIDHLKDIESISQNLRDKHPVPAIEAFDALPVSLRHEKVFFLMRIAALQQMITTRRDDYRAALREYATLFPGDPSVDLICLDEWVASKDYKAAFDCLDRLQAWNGGDPYLEAMRGAILLEEGKADAPDKAIELANAASKQDPRLLLPRVLVVEALAVQKKYDDAVIALQDYEKHANSQMKVDRLSLLKDFAASDAYKKFRNP